MDYRGFRGRQTCAISRKELVQFMRMRKFALKKRRASQKESGRRGGESRLLRGTRTLGPNCVRDLPNEVTSPKARMVWSRQHPAKRGHVVSVQAGVQ